MLSIINFIKKNIIKNKVLFYVGVFIYALGIVLGFVFRKGGFIAYYENNVLKFYESFLNPNKSVFNFLFLNVINVVLIYLVVALFSLNNLTLFLNYLLIFYKGYVLSISLTILLLAFSLNGFFIFLFLVFILNVITAFSILILMVNLNGNINFKDNCKKSYFVKNLIISLSIAIFGCAISFFFYVAIIRPFNLFF